MPKKNPNAPIQLHGANRHLQDLKDMSAALAKDPQFRQFFKLFGGTDEFLDAKIDELDKEKGNKP